MADLRLEERGEWLIDSMVETHPLVLRSVGGDRAGEGAINRYLGNDAIDPASILAPAIARTASAAAGRRVVVAQDTPVLPTPGRRTMEPQCCAEGKCRRLVHTLPPSHPLLTPAACGRGRLWCRTIRGPGRR